MERYIPKIKICGLTKVEETKIINEAKADFVGLVMFYQKSKRNNSIDTAEKILKAIDKTIKKVAVVVSPTIEQLTEIEKLNFDVIQIHGILDKEILKKTKLEIWRAININDYEQKFQLEVDKKITAYVVDGANSGSGEKFDWDKKLELNLNNKKLVLAGGLNSDNVISGINIFKPNVVDVSSGVEGPNGKIKEKVFDFIRMVRNYE